MTKPTWIKHWIGMSKDPKFADIIGEHKFEGTAVFWMFVDILESTACHAGVFAMSSNSPHTKYSLRAEFALLSTFVDDDWIQWALNLLVEKNLLDKDSSGVFKVINFEKYQHEYLSTERVSKHRNKEKHESMVTEIIQFLNSTKKLLGFETGHCYSTKTSSYRKVIGGRLDDGYTMDQFKKVIVYKCKKWQNTEWEKYLTPSTIFRPGHFDRYLNEVPDTFNTDIKSQKFIRVETISGVKKTITEEEFKRAEPGYYHTT